MTRSRRAGLSREEVRQQPLYARLLGLQYLAPSGFLCFVFLEGAVALGILLALAELVSWWGVLVLPATVAAMVKLNDVVAGALTIRQRPPVTRPRTSPHSRDTDIALGTETRVTPARLTDAPDRVAVTAPRDTKPTNRSPYAAPFKTAAEESRTADTVRLSTPGESVGADTVRLSTSTTARDAETVSLSASALSSFRRGAPDRDPIPPLSVRPATELPDPALPALPDEHRDPVGAPAEAAVPESPTWRDAAAQRRSARRAARKLDEPGDRDLSPATGTGTDRRTSDPERWALGPGGPISPPAAGPATDPAGTATINATRPARQWADQVDDQQRARQSAARRYD